MWLWQGVTPREGAWLGFWFNAGTFAAGTYWLYISIRIFGEAPLWVALLLMAALVVIMGLYHAALGLFRDPVAAGHRRGALVSRCARCVAAHRVVARLVSVRLLVAFARVFADRHVARELRADRRRVWHQRAVVVECGWRSRRCYCGTTRVRMAEGCFSCCPGSSGARCSRSSGLMPSGPPVSVAVVQGSISQEQKWLDSNQDKILKLYHAAHGEGPRERSSLSGRSRRYRIWRTIRCLISRQLYRETRAHDSGAGVRNSA